MGVASWQVTIAFSLSLSALMLIFEGRLHFRRASQGAAGHGFAGIVGNGVAYGLWFAIVRRLPAATASLGVLSARDRRRRLDIYSWRSVPPPPISSGSP